MACRPPVVALIEAHLIRIRTRESIEVADVKGRLRNP
jgi:hypothetical protein